MLAEVPHWHRVEVHQKQVPSGIDGIVTRDMSLHMELFAMLSVIIKHRCGPLPLLKVGLGRVDWMNVLLILETAEMLDPYRRLFTAENTMHSY